MSEYMYVYIYIYIPTYIHTYTYTYTFCSSPWPASERGLLLGRTKSVQDLR